MVSVNLVALTKPKLRWNRTSKSVCVLVAIAAYFALAQWAKRSYVDHAPPGKLVIRLNRPFDRYGEIGVVSYQLKLYPALEALADSDDNNWRSPLLLYEDDRLLGPAHSDATDVAYTGEGRYSHWKRRGFLFSSSDKNDPNFNGRSYWVVLPR
jgi:hypothetical protein